MKLELKRVSYSAALSQETNAFTADVYIDGVKRGSARNDGCGGMTFVEGEAARILADYAKSLPAEQHTFTGSSEVYTLQPTADSLVDNALTEFLIERDFKRAIARRILFTKQGRKGVYQLRAMKADALTQALQDTALAQRIKDCDRVLNLLPREEAFAIYRANA